MTGESEETDKHKSHRERNAGRKADKKKMKNPHVQELTDKQRNPKAFTFNSAVKAERRFRRKQDVDTNRQRLPLVDRTPLKPPPILIAIVGPPKVGKSLLIQCLIKRFTNHPVTNIIGPVTVVAGKHRRITFMECNNDINSMIDIAKVADLVLLLIDASFGFEMEIFEFLSICQVHGMPQIMGILNHLDKIKTKEQLQKTKKTLKRRFWTEVYAGVKVFYLSGLMHNQYLWNEMRQLSRFFTTMKVKPITWRTTHPYLLIDRIEDITSPEEIRKNPKVNRNITIYGYVRGVPLKANSMVHIPGCGDFDIKDICFLPDPCPLPDELKKRALVEKERLIYAPFSGVGGIVYDKDAVYIDLGGSHHHHKDSNGTSLLTKLQNPEEMLDEKLKESELKLFSDSTPIKSKDADNNIFGITSEDIIEDGRMRRKVIFNNNQNHLNNDQHSSANDYSDNNEEEESDNLSDINDYDDDVGRKRKFTFEDSITKRKKIEDFDETSDNNSSEDRQPVVQIKIKSKNKKSLNKSETFNRNSDNYIKDRISEALTLINKVPKNVKSQEKNNDRDDESFDELSDNESKDIGLMEFDREVVTQSHDEDEKREDEDEEDDCLRWRNNLAEKARDSFFNRQRENVNIEKIVYGISEEFHPENNESYSEEDSEKNVIGEIFHVVKQQQKRKLTQREIKNQMDCSFYSMESPRDWLLSENKALIINRFVTGKWKESEDAEELLRLDNLREEEEIYGDFEDLETGEKFKGITENGEETEKAEIERKKEMKILLEKKIALKKQFEEEYDKGENAYYDSLKNEAKVQGELNKSEFENMDENLRVQLEGYRPGLYIRLEFDSVPYELINHFDPSYPLIVGALLPGEQNVSYIQCRIKKHRWYPKILKNKNPLIISAGWRRFQIIPIFSKLEDNLRHRMLKYTPEHMACMAHFWGPIIPQSTGILAIQDVASRDANFRIVATGSVVETNKTATVVKKLKLTGIPVTIFKKSAFIKGMFNSELEIAKFEGAKIKTVSGIRGQIKKAVTSRKREFPRGTFRATFEDKIQLSDIVFCRTWYKIDIPKFYNPVTSLLLAPEERNQWRGMKTIGQLKRERNIRTEPDLDSLYLPIKRDVKISKPLVIPKNLQRELPYRDKPKFRAEPRRRGNNKVKDKRVAVVREPREEKINMMMKMIRKRYEYKQEKVKEETKKRVKEYKSKVEAEQVKRLKRQKDLKKELCRTLSKMEAKNKDKNFKRD